MTTRRDFMKAALATAGVAPFLGCQSFGAFNVGYKAPHRPSASNRVTLAVIGCGTMGSGNMAGFLMDKRVQVVCVCDPVLRAAHYSYNDKMTGGRDRFREIVDAHYKTTGCRMTADWREVVADPTIDAVLIATPDHWHALIAIAAMKAGKHVYCQKPMTFGISEGFEMVRVAKESGVTFQVGSQQRSASEFRIACELVASGYIGECKTCDIGLPGGNKGIWGRTTNCTPTTAPAYFKPDGMWDLWQGPAEHWENNAFIPGIHVPMSWRWNSRTGGGQITDWGAHHLDILQWMLGTETSGPVAIENMTHDRDVKDRFFDWAPNYAFDVVYGNGFRAHVSNKYANGLLFHGTKGDLFVTRGRLNRPEFLKKWNERKDLQPGDKHLYAPRGGVGHEADFIDGIYSGGRTACPCEVGHRSITIAHLANICERLGISGLKWDPVAERVVGNDAAQAMTVVKHHNGWKI